MPKALLSESEFEEMFTKFGPRQMAKRLGISERQVLLRRRRIEGRTGQIMVGPTVRLQITVSEIVPKEYSHRQSIEIVDGIAIIASDAHYWPGPASLMHRALVSCIKEYKPKLVVLNGDVIDAPTISRHPPIGWESRPKLADEMEAAKERLSEIEAATFKARKVWTLGNHDCCDDKTECLTRRGWLKYTEIVPSDEVLSYDNGNAVWSPINEIVQYPFDGNLVRIEKTRCSLAVTSNHRVLLSRLNSRSKAYDILEYRMADDLPYSFNIPMAGVSVEKGIDLTNDQIALAGWILTDGGFQNEDISIYQSKPQGIATIESLLHRLNLGYSRYERQREARIICGREPVIRPLPAVQFRIYREYSREIRKWLPSKGRLPGWTTQLSKEQFEIFLEAIVAGDGVWDGNVEARTCCVIYGTKEFLGDMQAVAVCHGWRARFATDNRGTYRLCLSKTPNLRIERPQIFSEAYSGIVWCLRVPHENFMVRRNGSAYFTGNSRFSTRIATVAPEYAKIHGVHLSDHFPVWEPAWSCWINDAVVVKHRFKGGIHASHNNTVMSGKSMITGHLHSAKVSPWTDYNGTRYGVDGGCIADTDHKAFTDYTEDNARNWRSAFCVLTFTGGRLLMPELVTKWDDSRVQFRGGIFVP